MTALRSLKGNLLNEALRTHRTKFRSTLPVAEIGGQPKARLDRRMARQFELPSGTAVESILTDEMRGLETVLRAWSARSGLDARKLYFRNTTTKRVLYTSDVMVLPDLLRSSDYRRNGSNTRIQVLAAKRPEQSVRLEAITTANYLGKQFRYALSVQYQTDRIGRPWQLLRPVILIDQSVLSRIQAFDAFRDHEIGLLDSLRLLISQGMHDYVHGTVLRWFPPPQVSMPHAYTSMMFDQPRPETLRHWHEKADTPWPRDFCDDQFAQDIEPLELYSLLVHAENAASTFSDFPSARDGVNAIAGDFFQKLTRFSAWCADRDDGRTIVSIDRYLSVVALWFLAGIFPVGSAELTEIVQEKDWFGFRRTQALSYFGDVHGGFFAYINRISPDAFIWGGEPVNLEDVTRSYAEGLSQSAVASHIDALLGYSGSFAGGYLHLLAETAPQLAALANTVAAQLAAVRQADLSAPGPAGHASRMLARLANCLKSHPGERSAGHDTFETVSSYALSLADYLAVLARGSSACAGRARYESAEGTA